MNFFFVFQLRANAANFEESKLREVDKLINEASSMKTSGVMQTAIQNCSKFHSGLKSNLKNIANKLYEKQTDLLKIQTLFSALQPDVDALTDTYQNQDKLTSELITNYLLKCKSVVNQTRTVRYKVQSIDPDCKEVQVLQSLEERLLAINQDLHSVQKSKMIEQTINEQREKDVESVTQAKQDVETIEAHFKEIVSEPPDSPEQVVSLLKSDLIKLIRLRLILRKYALQPDENVKSLVQTILSKQQKVLIKVRKMFSQTTEVLLMSLQPEQLHTKVAAFVMILKNKLQSWRPYNFDNDHLMTILSHLEVLISIYFP